MRLLRYIAVALLLPFSVLSAQSVEIERGLLFKSYEVSPDMRTSLAIPAEKESHIRFGRWFTLSFDLRIDVNRECFGYVCRVIVDGNQNIDVVLTNSDTPFLSIASANKQLVPLKLADNADIAEWNRITVRVCADNDDLRIYGNDTEIASLPVERKNHTADIFFGTNNQELFSTTDAAPMAIRNVAVSLERDNKPEYVWPLDWNEGSNIVDTSGRLNAAVQNSQWLVEDNSRWRKIKELHFKNRVFHVGDLDHGRLLFVTDDRVALFSIQSGQSVDYGFVQDIKINLITNDFLVLPDGALVYFDPEESDCIINRFDFDKSCWQSSVRRNSHSKYIHHNTFINPLDSSVVQLFGYAFHRYLNEANRLPVGSSKVERFNLDAIPPRYLSAVGVADTVAYIYGGKGNDKGIQALGVTTYDDLYALDLRDYSVRKLWESDVSSHEVAASNLVVSPDGKHFRALFYNPNTFKSKLQLREFSIADGKSRPEADTIAYDFLDVNSEASLYYDSGSATYYAVVIHKENLGGYVVEIYTIKAPIVDLATLRSPERRWPEWWVISLIALAFAGAAIALFDTLRRNRRRNALNEEESVEAAEEVAAPRVARTAAGIYIIGGFKVINSRGNDITAAFTPIMRQLLLLIILYNRNNGISNAELKEALWFDKSEESYYNNRGVNIRKIRLLLEEVGRIEIVSNNGYWHMAGDEHLCDYTDYFHRLTALNPANISHQQLQEIIDIAHYGTLLPSIQFEWFDRFKAEYTDTVITILSHIRDNGEIALSPKVRIELADAVLLFDSLDEASVRTKCLALIEMKRIGIAKNVFNSFTQEYKRLMAENYAHNFNTFIREEPKQ